MNVQIVRITVIVWTQLKIIHVCNVYALLDSLETAVKAMPLRPLAIPVHVAAILINILNVITSLMDFTYVPVKQDGRVVTAIKLLIHAILILVKTLGVVPLIAVAFLVIADSGIPARSVKL